MVTEHLHPLLYDASSLVLLPRWICLSTRHRLPTWPAHARYMVRLLSHFCQVLMQLRARLRWIQAPPR